MLTPDEILVQLSAYDTIETSWDRDGSYAKIILLETRSNVYLVGVPAFGVFGNGGIHNVVYQL